MDQTRRQFLKFVAASPLVLTFGLAVSPIMRYLKPTMRPLGFFEPSDQPTGADEILFSRSDFPVEWTCIPFMYRIRYAEFNPEQYVFREVPSFIIRTFGEEIVAYSRVCPAHGCILNYWADPGTFNCGCGTKTEQCCCALKIRNPVLHCPCDGSTFDLADNAHVIRGPARRAPRKFELNHRKNEIAIGSLEPGSIV